MKIEGTVKAVDGPLSGESRPKTQPKVQQQTPGSDAKVELSSLSSSLGKAEAAMAATPMVDSERVAEIRQAISEGRYKVDASKIADGLIDSVRQMLDAQPGRP